MAEVMLDLRRVPKDRAYAQLHSHIIGVLSGIDDDIAGMATISALIHHAFDHLWTGFYRVVGPDLLRVGPYQGTLGCLEIQFGRGVCGTAALTRRTLSTGVGAPVAAPLTMRASARPRSTASRAASSSDIVPSGAACLTNTSAQIATSAPNSFR